MSHTITLFDELYGRLVAYAVAHNQSPEEAFCDLIEAALAAEMPLQDPDRA